MRNWNGGNREQGALKPGCKLVPRASTARRSRKQGALKAHLQSAQGSALGNCVHLPNSAPCKGSYIKMGNSEWRIEGCSCPYRAQFLYLRVYPRRCLGLVVVAPSGRGMPRWQNQWSGFRGAKRHKYQINGATFGAQIVIKNCRKKGL